MKERRVSACRIGGRLGRAGFLAELSFALPAGCCPATISGSAAVRGRAGGADPGLVGAAPLAGPAAQPPAAPAPRDAGPGAVSIRPRRAELRAEGNRATGATGPRRAARTLLGDGITQLRCGARSYGRAGLFQLTANLFSCILTKEKNKKLAVPSSARSPSVQRGLGVRREPRGPPRRPGCATLRSWAGAHRALVVQVILVLIFQGISARRVPALREPRAGAVCPCQTRSRSRSAGMGPSGTN